MLMMASKLTLVRNGQNARIHHHSHMFNLDLERIKSASVKSMKRFGYISVFIILRLSIKGTHFLKTKTLSLVGYLQSKMKRNNGASLYESEKKEVSGYLKSIAEYRNRIRQMKHKIKEEEGIE